jgi:hypothetical protein
MDVVPGLWPPSGSHAELRLRADARSRNGGIRQELATAIGSRCQPAGPEIECELLGDGLTLPQFAHAYFQAAKHGHSSGRNKPSSVRPDLRFAGARYLFGRGVPAHAGLGILKPCPR